MSKLTITEALQEIKTIGSRLEKKRAGIAQYIARDARVRDPFESTGGSAKYVKEERQSISDLDARIVKIRTEIQRSNLTSPLKIGETSKTVSEWLTWRREIADKQRQFLGQMSKSVQAIRANIQKQGGKVSNSLASAEVNLNADAPPEVVVNLDEKELLVELDEMEQTLGTLDGKLSLFNATTEIDV